MQYKTIALEMLQQHPEIHNQIRTERMLMATMELYARELKIRHEVWKAFLAKALPKSDPRQIESYALEIALTQVKNILHSQIFSDEVEDEETSVEAKTGFILGRVPLV